MGRLAWWNRSQKTREELDTSGGFASPGAYGSTCERFADERDEGDFQNKTPTSSEKKTRTVAAECPNRRFIKTRPPAPPHFRNFNRAAANATTGLPAFRLTCAPGSSGTSAPVVRWWGVWGRWEVWGPARVNIFRHVKLKKNATLTSEGNDRTCAQLSCRVGGVFGFFVFFFCVEFRGREQPRSRRSPLLPGRRRESRRKPRPQVLSRRSCHFAPYLSLSPCSSLGWVFFVVFLFPLSKSTSTCSSRLCPLAINSGFVGRRCAPAAARWCAAVVSSKTATPAPEILD